MASRLFAEVLLYGGSYVVRAVAQAYRVALAEAAAGGASRAQRVQPVLRGIMSKQEARSILQLEEGAAAEQVEARFSKLLKANDPERGGSQYIRYKLLNARQALSESTTK
mmetsp:Transcript_6603/g.19997  ORF Transcript_6603/g.19997 Transcript_6603/m.19997 type:complete len:110 (+) Transcript_6603:12-341(+)